MCNRYVTCLLLQHVSDTEKAAFESMRSLALDGAFTEPVQATTRAFLKVKREGQPSPGPHRGSQNGKLCPSDHWLLADRFLHLEQGLDLGLPVHTHCANGQLTLSSGLCTFSWATI